MVESTALIGNVSLINLVLFVFLFWFTVLIANIISTSIGNFLKPKIKKTSYKIPGKIVQYFLIFSFTYYGLANILKFDFTAFVAAFGIIGIAVAFSAQQTARNLIAWVFILFGRIIKLGDWIEVPNFPTTGPSQVKDISLTTTILREENGRLIIVPNSTFIENKIIKYPDGDFFKTSFQLKISSKSNLERVKKIIYNICSKNEKILPNIPKKERSGLRKILKNIFADSSKVDIKKFEPNVTVTDISDGAIALSVFIWIWEINNKDNIISSIMEELLKEFPKNGIRLV